MSSKPVPRVEPVPGVADIHVVRNTLHIPLLSEVQVLAVRPGGLAECDVPRHLIDHEEVPVREEWAADLAAQMLRRQAEKGGTGQKTPIQLGWIVGETLFRIIDGFHRDKALIMNGEALIYSTAERTDWDGLYDDRILFAKDHDDVRFSRVVKWMNECWGHSGLDEAGRDNHFTLLQAILLTRFDTNGTHLGLTPDEVEAAKLWVTNKEDKWGIKAMTIHGYLQTADKVDPALVNAVREKKGGHALEAPTQQIISIFREMLPDSYDLQNLVWIQAKAHNLKGPQVKALCVKVHNLDAEKAEALVSGLDVSNIEPLYGETKKKQLRRASDPRHKGSAVLNAAATEIDRVNQRVRQSIDRGEEVGVEAYQNLEQTIRAARRLQGALGTLAANIAELRDKNGTPPVPVLTKAQIDKAYERHKRENALNRYRTPRTRVNRYVAIELPRFGRFTDEDWPTLEDYHRFALVLDHPAITNGQFKSKAALYMKVLELASIVEKGQQPTSAQQLQDLVVAHTKPLMQLSPIGTEIITLDKARGRPVITDKGRIYLADVVNNALIAVDDSK